MEEAPSYVQSEDLAKREALAVKLLESRDFVDYWTMRFCDILLKRTTGLCVSAGP